jgi:phytoene/squalene synthetase
VRKLDDDALDHFAYRVAGAVASVAVPLGGAREVEAVACR